MDRHYSDGLRKFQDFSGPPGAQHFLSVPLPGLSERVEKRFCRFQIGCIETFHELLEYLL
jgi:hypothetical protein